MAKLPKGVTLTVKAAKAYDRVLTPAALGFVADLHRQFEGERKALLARRAARQKDFDRGLLPDFLPETAAIRAGDWKVAPIPPDLRDRRVEITGPTDRKMIINALNSGARVFLADFEDSNAPTWDNLLQGQLNLMDRWTSAMDHVDRVSGKRYALGQKPAVLMVRPRGWHLDEAHLAVDGKSVSGALFDFGLYAFHNARTTIAKGSGPYFYLPKLESHLEARLWNSVFVFAQSRLGMPLGTIKATVLIETLPAAFEMDEIIYELRDHMAGLNCGRWDYIFSFIKTFAANKSYLLPDRSQLVMSDGFLAAYSALLVKTCHRRGCFAMGGMAAQIPNRKDPDANRVALERVRADKEREARNGHDGTWVAHPDLVPVAMEIFNDLMPTQNQLYVLREDVDVGQKELLQVHAGTRTEEGFRENIRVGVQYIEAWLRGRGAVPLYNLMEDAATAEIARAQIWQWLRFGARLDNGQKVTTAFFETCLAEEMAKVKDEIGAETYGNGRFRDAIALFRTMTTSKDFVTFLTIPAYRKIA
ncbi:MAG: malate synthase A [Hyphomicrobiales bacterium]